MVVLVEALDSHFAWMLDGTPAALDGLSLPAGGVDGPDVLNLLRGIAATHRATGAAGMWLIVNAGEIAGLCGYLSAVRNGQVDIGYGIAVSCRRRGLATQAVAAMIGQAMRDGIAVITASTAIGNLASQRVLQQNGFQRCGERVDPEDGALYDWRLAMVQPEASAASYPA